jgi:type IV fimbrial biogenesis protein FimT
MTTVDNGVRAERTIAVRQRAFTLLELMVTLVVAGILVGVGVPSFIDIVRSSRTATNVNELVTALSIARSEAIRRGGRISVCRSADGAACGGTWEDGWIVFRDDTVNDGGAPVVGEVLRIWPEASGDATITTLSGGANVDLEWVRFLPRGGALTTVALPIVYNVELPGCSSTQARNIELNAIGRTAVTADACP